VKKNVSTRFYGISLGLAPFNGGGADIGLGVQKYSDSQGLKGAFVVSFHLGIGFSL